MTPKSNQYLPAVKLDLNGPSKTLLICFAGIGGRGTLPVFEFAGVTSELSVNKIFIRDPFKTWYHRGLLKIASNIDEIANFLNKMVGDLNTEKLVLVGNSMGGYAALLFGCLLQADEAHAFSPKTLITPFRRLLLADVWSWRNILALQMSKSAQPEYFDL